MNGNDIRDNIVWTPVRGGWLIELVCWLIGGHFPHFVDMEYYGDEITMESYRCACCGRDGVR